MHLLVQYLLALGIMYLTVGVGLVGVLALVIWGMPEIAKPVMDDLHAQLEEGGVLTNASYTTTGLVLCGCAWLLWPRVLLSMLRSDDE